MATTLGTGDIVRSTIVVSDFDQTALLNHHWAVTGEALGGATDQDFANTFDGLIAADVKALLYNLADYKGVLVQKISPAPITARVQATGNAGVGTAGTPGLPRQTAGLIDWRTALAGPSQRGRTFMCFPAAADSDGAGAPTNGYMTRLSALITDLLGFGIVTGAGGSIAVVLSILHVDDMTTTPVTDGLGRQVWATQKRRGTLGKPNVSPIA